MSPSSTTWKSPGKSAKVRSSTPTGRSRSTQFQALFAIGSAENEHGTGAGGYSRVLMAVLIDRLGTWTGMGMNVEGDADPAISPVRHGFVVNRRRKAFWTCAVLSGPGPNVP